MRKYKNNIQDQYGNALPAVTITVRTNPGGALATIFSDNGVSAKSNPFINDTDGEFFFYAPDGRYDIELTGGAAETITDILFLDIATTGTTVRVNTDIVTATPPTTETVAGSFQIYDLDNDDKLAEAGFFGSNELQITNRMHGGAITLRGENAAGSLANVFNGDPDGASNMYYAGVKRVSTNVTGDFAIHSNTNTDTENRRLILQYQDGTQRGYLGYNASAALTLRNVIHGGPVVISGEDTGGVVRTIINGDPDGAISTYHAGGTRTSTNTNGRFLVHSDANTDTEQRALNLCHLDGTVRAQVGQLTTGILEINNLTHGHGVLIAAEDAGGTKRTILNADPDARTTLRGDGDVYIESNAGENAIICAANGAVSIYYNGQLQLRTSDEAGSDIGMGAEVRHNDDAYYPVGMNVAPEDNTLNSGNLTLAQSHVGKMITYNTATARSLILNNVSAIKVGALCSLLVGGSAGVLTGDGGTGVQIRWWNGTGWTTTAAAGNITIGVGQYTIWKQSDTFYWISGPTLS